MAEAAVKKDVQQHDRRKKVTDTLINVGSTIAIAFVTGIASGLGARVFQSLVGVRPRRDGNVIPMNRAN